MAGRSFDARFGTILRSEGIAAIPASLFKYQGRLNLSAQEMWLICALLSHKWDDRDPYPSISQIAKRSGVPRTTIQTYLAQIKAKGLIDVEERYQEQGGRTSSSYSFDGLFDKLEQLVLGGDVDTCDTPLSNHRAGGVDTYVTPLSTHASQSRVTLNRYTEAERNADAISFRSLGLMVALALRRSEYRDEAAQRLTQFAMSTERTVEAVNKALANWEIIDGEEALWEMIGRFLNIT